MKTFFQDNGIEVSYEARMPMEHEQGKFNQVLEEIKTTARIVILATYPEYVPAFMVAAKRQGMTNGDYVYIVSTISDIHQVEGVDYWWNGISGIVDKAEAEKAWHSVLTLVPRPYNYTKYERFQKRVIEKSKAFQWKRSNETQSKVVHYAVYLYDAVYLYALALNKTFANQQDPRNGTAVFNNMKRTEFESMAGFDVQVDDNGDVEFNMTLLEFVNNEKGEREMKTVGEFKRNKTDANQILELIPGMNITWSEDSRRTSPPADRPACGFMGELCSTPSPSPTHQRSSIANVTASVVVSLLIVACTVLILLYYRKRAFEKELASQIWKVNYRDIVIRPAMGIGMSRLSNISEISVSNRSHSGITVGTYKGNPIVVKRVEKDQVDLTRAVLLELKQIREVHHPNLTRFFGACVEASNICILTEYCSRGSLQEIILNEEIKLDNVFIHSFILEIATGMQYLHSADIKFHGHLTSSNCVVDSRWVLKITDHGLREFKSPNEQRLSVRVRDYQVNYQKLLWTAPEILRQKRKHYTGSPKGDVYSFAIIVHELETRNLPYSECHLESEEIVGRVSAGTIPHFRPPLTTNVANDDLHLVMKMCWREIPEERPDFWEIRKLLKKLHGGKNNLVDKIIYMLEEHSLNLEKLVEKRTEQWIEEKKRTEELLHSMLPKSVADQLKSGRPVEAENFDEVTVFFSDIVGFTALSSESTPLQIVTLLNDLYTAFDAILQGYDAYKVETIGDAYMVVSGLPIRNGHQHAEEIACMALHLLQSVEEFKIRHRPNKKLKLRIGIHSGPVCAGVVGLKMPRYCLFGDTVNTASRMESNGEALKIHISGATQYYLERIGGYIMKERGAIDIKGKGTLVTYWLHGKIATDHSSKALTKTLSGSTSVDYSSSGVVVELDGANYDKSADR